MLNARRTERLTGGADRVEFVCVEPGLSDKLVVNAGCVVDQGRLERLGRDTFSGPRRVSAGSGGLGGQRDLVARLDEKDARGS